MENFLTIEKFTPAGRIKTARKVFWWALLLLVVPIVVAAWVAGNF